MTDPKNKLNKRLKRIENALNSIANVLKNNSNHDSLIIPDGPAAVYEAATQQLYPIDEVAAVDIDLLRGIDATKRILIANTERFANGFAANNALLWGARGMGKSSLVKAVHRNLIQKDGALLTLIEIHREDIQDLPLLLRTLAQSDRRFLLFCDDLSFTDADKDFKALKSVLEGGIEGRPKNVLFYATANRRHLLPRDMAQNEVSTAINPGETVDETVALSDRFGLWLGFYPCDQETWLAMVEGYMKAYDIRKDSWRADALEWSRTRGSRSGRVAWQYIQDLAGTLGKSL